MTFWRVNQSLNFRCKICSNAFVSEKATAQHMKLVHKVPGPTGRLPTATKKEKMKKSKTTSISAETKTVEVTGGISTRH